MENLIECHRVHKNLMAEKRQIEQKLEKFYQHMDKLQLRRNTEIIAEKSDLPEKQALENNLKHEQIRSKYIQQMEEKYSPVAKVQNVKEPEDENIEKPETDLEENCKSLYNKELDSKLRPSPVSSEEQLISNNILSNEDKTDQVKLNLIKSKTLLIELIDKEIQKVSNKNCDQGMGEAGAGGDTYQVNNFNIKQRELKEKRLKSIATIKRELEILENLDCE